MRANALIALARFPEALPCSVRPFSVRVAGEMVSIPERIHHEPSGIDIRGLSDLQCELVDCLLTRHHDGFVRQRYLEKIIRSGNPWIPPFVIRLAGEYVIEILDVIADNLTHLDRALYGQFVWWNPEFVALTSERVMSYWNEYHRTVRGYIGLPFFKPDEYVGFRLMRFFKSLAQAQPEN